MFLAEFILCVLTAFHVFIQSVFYYERLGSSYFCYFRYNLILLFKKQSLFFLCNSEIWSQLISLWWRTPSKHLACPGRIWFGDDLFRFIQGRSSSFPPIGGILPLLKESTSLLSFSDGTHILHDLVCTTLFLSTINRLTREIPLYNTYVLIGIFPDGFESDASATYLEEVPTLASCFPVTSRSTGFSITMLLSLDLSAVDCPSTEPPVRKKMSSPSSQWRNTHMHTYTCVRACVCVSRSLSLYICLCVYIYDMCL